MGTIDSKAHDDLEGEIDANLAGLQLEEDRLPQLQGKKPAQLEEEKPA
jgi:hypothetical protein